MAEHTIELRVGQLAHRRDYIRLHVYMDGLAVDVDPVFDGNFTPEEAIQMAVKIFEVAVKILSKEELEAIKNDIKHAD